MLEAVLAASVWVVFPARSSGWTTKLDGWSGLQPVPVFRP